MYKDVIVVSDKSVLSVEVAIKYQTLELLSGVG